MEYKASTVGPTRSNAPPPLVPEAESDIEVDVGPDISVAIPNETGEIPSICAFQHSTAIVLGEKDVVAECDGPVALEDAEPGKPSDNNLPVLSLEFVKKVFKFGPNVPPGVPGYHQVRRCILVARVRPGMYYLCPTCHQRGRQPAGGISIATGLVSAQK